jgi:NhaP-type Na+/H+ or K+/H+ antiporter
MELLVVAVIGLLTVAGATTIAPHVRIASPLILVVLGIVVSFLPFVPPIEVDPEWIIAGVLPPLLYSASVAMPAMNFRREFRSIRGLAVTLVFLSAVVLGLFFSWAIPGLGIWWGIALGAIVSPTDAVATTIVERVGVSGRVASVLQGESLLNDASALVLLRAAIAGSAVTRPLLHLGLEFLYAVVVAVTIGAFVGWANLAVRARIKDPTVNTIVTFTVPFLASIPAEMLEASGLVAAVVAGLVTGHGAPRRLPVQHRSSDTQNWKVVELVLESAIFLLMGLELHGIASDVDDTDQLGTALVVALGGLALIIAVRAAYVTELLWSLHRKDRPAPRISAIVARIRGRHPQEMVPAERKVRRREADREYFEAAPLGWRDGATLVWSGMRGAVTVAAAQTLPARTPGRSLLVLIAFIVAAASLLLQGGTLATFVRWLFPDRSDDAIARERAALQRMLADVRKELVEEIPESELPTRAGENWALADPDQMAEARELALRIVEAQRATLLDARDDGIFSAVVLGEALQHLDSVELSIELRAG